MLKWLLAGIGDIATKRVIPAILAESRSELHGVVTRDPDKGNGQINVSTYSNANVDRLLTQAFATINDDARAKLVQEADKIVMQEDRPVLAIIRHRYAYAVRSDLNFRPRIDTFLTAMQISPAK